MKATLTTNQGLTSRKTVMAVALIGLFAGQFSGPLSSSAFAATAVESGEGGATIMATTGTADTLTITASAGVSVSHKLTVNGNLDMTDGSISNVTTLGATDLATLAGGATITKATNINITGTATTTIGNVDSLTKVDGAMNIAGTTTAAAITSAGAANINTTGTAASKIGNSNAATTVDLTGGASTLTVIDAAVTLSNGVNSIAVSGAANTVVGVTNINVTGTAASRVGNSNAATTVDLAGGASSLSISNSGNSMLTALGGSVLTTASLASMSMSGVGAGRVATTATGTGITGSTNTNTATRANIVEVNGNTGTSNLAGATQGTTGAMNIVMKGHNGATESIASLTLTNGIGNAHGIQIYEDRTRISGGINSTQMMLNEDDVVFSHVGTGAPIPVRGVADGTTDFDAVNYRQLKNVKYGVAASAAMANIPQVGPGEKLTLGAGVGSFDNQSALAIGMSYRLAPAAILKASVAAAGSSRATFGLGAAVSW